MARMDFDTRRRNDAGQLIGGHTSRPHERDEEWPPRKHYSRAHVRRILATTSKHQAQPPAPKHTVDVAIFTLNNMGDHITHARDAATALRALLHPEAVAARSVSIHGWIDGVQYSGAVPLAFVRQLLG